jgi:epoxyqueuosine reductase
MSEIDMFKVAKWIEKKIVDFVEESPDNSLKNDKNDPAWGTPLVAFSRGDDSLFVELKNDIGPFYWTPQEPFGLAYPELTITADELAVISWILPQTRLTRQDHRRETSYPAEAWSRARLYGEQFNELLRSRVVEWLRAADIPAVAPFQLREWQRQESERYGIASNWSERHAAYVAGLGTFGLSDGLITPVGKAMRCGSVVARLPVPVALRPYNKYNAYCLFYSQGTCGKCIERCPAGAISDSGHDKKRCAAYLENVTSPYVEKSLGKPVSSCGLCQVGIPCEAGIPPVSGKSHVRV